MAIDISGTCNLRCEMCVLHESFLKKGMMSFDTFHKLAGQITQIPFIRLSNNCEPMLNPNMARMIALLKSSNSKVFVELTTNGTLLSNELSEALIDSTLDRLQVSLDGATKQTFEKIRSGADFDKVVANVENLIYLKQKRNSNLPVLEIVFVAMKSNIQELKDVVDMAASYGIRSITVNGLEPYSPELDDLKLWSSKAEPRDTSELMEEISHYARSKNITMVAPRLFTKKVFYCAITSPIISWDGSVSPCSPLSYERTVYYDGNKITMPHLSFGNINDTSFWEIWNSQAFVKFRRSVMFGRLPPYCKNCLMKKQVICPSR
jgi:MoaA/NifB/PqqE/SkfB family radical SAM enzyme